MLMENNLLFVVATPFEIAPLHTWLEESTIKVADNIYSMKGLTITILVTGLGTFNMSFQCGKLFGSGYKPQLAVNAGLAGSFDTALELTTVVNVYKDTFADVGVYEKDGSFTSIFDLELIKPDVIPFKQGWLENDSHLASFLPNKTAITVNTTSGDEARIKVLKDKYNADLESMEGASFAHACQMSSIPYLQIRVLSNYVEPRNRMNWKIDQSIARLNEVLIHMVQAYAAP